METLIFKYQEKLNVWTGILRININYRVFLHDKLTWESYHNLLQDFKDLFDKLNMQINEDWNRYYVKYR